MSATENLGLENIEVDLTNLYRDELITDCKVAQIRRLIPIKSDGSDDSTRPVLYSGSTQIMLPTGPIPISAEIDAESLEDALKKFPEAIKNAVDEMVARVQQMQREEASRIVTPSEFAGNGSGFLI